MVVAGLMQGDPRFDERIDDESAGVSSRFRSGRERVHC
jgi:hypothetical protein